MTTQREVLLERIVQAVEGVQRAAENEDCKEIIDWATTVQLLTAELVTTAITQVRNK